jgi:2,3-bisphosphoglycerate-independent phosphoglycerate mutase
MSTQKPLVLVILDGFGYSPEKAYNAIAHAHTPHLDAWFKRCPHTLLKASGKAVGLLDHMAGNSEVGHLTLGAGRVVPQPITIIQNAIDDGSFFSLPTLCQQLQKLKENKGTLHIMGLLSDGGVHSYEKQLYAFMQVAVQQGIHDIVIHAFLDGRDVPPQSAARYLEQLEQYINNVGYGVIGSVHGRFYAMDRDRNGERTQKSYDALTVSQHGDKINWRSVLEKNYAHQITDEFIEPTQLDPACIVKPHDGIIFFNVRPDRVRQLIAAFVGNRSMLMHYGIADCVTGTDSRQIPLTFFITPVSLLESDQITVLFDTPVVHNTLKEVLAHAGKTIFTIAETEKYAHVTYFFSGYREQPFATEVRHLVPSLHKKNYVHNPKMSALKITEMVVKSLVHKPCDFYLINYANADMVGHSGDFDATVKAVECLDAQLKMVYDQIVKKMDGTLCITADHGKAESMIDLLTGKPRTAHTTNDVPFLLVKQEGSYHAPEKQISRLKRLSDVAPVLLELMQLPLPVEMQF